MYGELLDGLADDIEAGGPTARVLEGHEDDPGPSALALRLLGSVHRMVLERQAGGLATYYPSVGGTWEAESGVPAFLHLLEEQPEAVRAWLDRLPQTNEVGRAAALAGGLQRLGGPVRLFEIGASAGLNLLVEHHAFLEGASVLRIEHRVGCDLRPIDPTTTEGRLALTAYVWPDQAARIERLRAALDIAQRHLPEVRRQGAGDFVQEIELSDGASTVLWHSVMWQYLPADEQARVTQRIEELGTAASDDRPFAHLFLEPTRRHEGGHHEFLVVLTTWPGGQRRILGTAAPHGLPVTWD